LAAAAGFHPEAESREQPQPPARQPPSAAEGPAPVAAHKPLFVRHTRPKARPPPPPIPSARQIFS
jgi:hypothetical protein